ncbi:ABC transporter permease [Acutalibacter intestini]|uniref:ABC transporter permease n=1 Tax=Acutalibacter intestini TaxID=3093659 RepID=UPI002AC95DC4|nr:ABC transporter permease [Acutalibacter sp. M00204]
MLKLYPRLAWQNVRKNYRVTVPYMLSGAGIIMMYYMIYAIKMGCDAAEMLGARTVAATMGFGVIVIGIFAAIFIFYTNSFLMKRRKRELGLYNILGMEKRHIGMVILTETMITFLISLAFGLGLGIAFSKLFFLILDHLMAAASPIPFLIPAGAIVSTVLLFGVIYLVTAMYNILQVRLSKPIELLHSSSVGEKEPKARWFLALIGVALLGAGYYLALTIEDPVMALLLFFVAVVLVILGTYLLFIVGITALLKLLKKNKGFYYQTKHFTTLSGMLYRMKQNAAGLASICILFTCLLVTVSTTFSLYTGVEDMVAARNPNDVNFELYDTNDQALEGLKELTEELCARQGLSITHSMDRKFWSFAGSRVGNVLYDGDGTMSNQYYMLEVYTLSDYNRYNNTHETLAPGEALLYDPAGNIEAGTIEHGELTVFDETFQVRKVDFAQGVASPKSTTWLGYSDYALVLDDTQFSDGIFNASGSQKRCDMVYRIDLSDNSPQAVQRFSDLYWDEAEQNWLAISQNGGSYERLVFSTKASDLTDAMELYGGLFFLGLFMGAVFLMGTVLIIYYKQVSEGYEDARRFDIMQKVGMSHQEVKRSIHSQVLMVFFLPLFMAILHLGVAFHMLQLILAMLNMVNFTLILISMVGCVLVFSVMYLVIYLLTARTYYKIVETAA